MTTSSPTVSKPINLMWAGAGLGVFVGIGIFALSVIVFMLWATLDASGTPEAVNTGAMWLFGGILIVIGIFPAALIGALTGAVIGSVYKRRSSRLSPIGTTLLGTAIGGTVLLFSYLTIQGLIGSAEWETFLAAYAGDAGSLVVVMPYILLVLGGFIWLSHSLNRRLPQS